MINTSSTFNFQHKHCEMFSSPPNEDVGFTLQDEISIDFTDKFKVPCSK